MKDILIPVSDSPECVLALEQGFQLGQNLNANVIGCHIRPHDDSSIDIDSDDIESFVSDDEYDLMWRSTLDTKKKSGDQHVNAKELFKSVSEDFNYQLRKNVFHDPCSIWIERIGSPNKVFSIIGPLADLIVVSRPLNKRSSVAKTIMYDAVLNSSSPVLVLPQEKTPWVGKNISIAWNQSTEASMAVKVALPLLMQANKVNIITCGTESRLGPKSTHLQKYLSHWGITADHSSIEDKTENLAVLRSYTETQSDLLVMGGYSRSRLRERIFGGMTEHMLTDVDIPVFILHK